MNPILRAPMEFKDSELSLLPSPIFVLGSAHSGKSEFAMRPLSSSKQTSVIGTGAQTETDLNARIAELKAMRPGHWIHYEQPSHLMEIMSSIETEQVLVDSVNAFIASRFVNDSQRYSIEQTEAQLRAEIKNLCELLPSLRTQKIVLVSNDIGSSLPPSQHTARILRRLVGQANQMLAASCASVFIVHAGIAQLIKGKKNGT